jgi:hypothetical protein
MTFNIYVIYMTFNIYVIYMTFNIYVICKSQVFEPFERGFLIQFATIFRCKVIGKKNILKALQGGTLGGALWRY